MSSLTIIATGRVTKDVVVEQSKAGKSYCRFYIATDKGYGDYAETNFTKVVLFNGQAEAAAANLGQGSLIQVKADGYSLETWNTDDGPQAVMSITPYDVDYLVVKKPEQQTE